MRWLDHWCVQHEFVHSLYHSGLLATRTCRLRPVASVRLRCVERFSDELTDHQFRSLLLRDQALNISDTKDNKDGGINDCSGMDLVVHPVGSCHFVLAVHRWAANSSPWRMLHSGIWTRLWQSFTAWLWQLSFISFIQYSTSNITHAPLAYITERTITTFCLCLDYERINCYYYYNISIPLYIDSK